MRKQGTFVKGRETGIRQGARLKIQEIKYLKTMFCDSLDATPNEPPKEKEAEKKPATPIPSLKRPALAVALLALPL
jgi:hypothetical protein